MKNFKEEKQDIKLQRRKTRHVHNLEGEYNERLAVDKNGEKD